MCIPLLPNKSIATYTKMWKVIHDACPSCQPHYFFVDFEQAAINSFNSIWTLTQVKAFFFFHLSQSVYKKFKSLGLQSEYHNQWRNCGGGWGGALPPPFYNACSPHLWKMIYSTKRIVMTITFYCPPIWGLLLPQNLKFVTPLIIMIRNLH